jgi:hypothetical protein
MFILIGILILLIFGFMYIITIYFTTSNNYIPEITTMSENEKKKQQLYDNIMNKFIYPNQTTTTIANTNNVQNPTTSNNI